VRAGAGNLVAAGLLLAVAAAVVFLTLDFPPPGDPNDPGAGTFPRMIAGLLAGCGLLLLFQRSETEPLPRGSGLLRVAGVVVLLGGYAALLEPLGFVLASVLFLAAALLLAGVRRPLLLAVLPPGISLALFYVFYVLLRVSLPRGVIEGVIF
jgi:putative tricarboxylic transport membrane protein